MQTSLKDEARKHTEGEAALLTITNLYSNSQEEVNRLSIEINKLNRKLNEVENVSSELKNTILLLNTEKDTALLQHKQSLVRVSDLESKLSQVQAELENSEQKGQMLDKELKQKREEVDTLQTKLKDEAHKHIEAEASLLMMTNMHSQSQEEVSRLHREIEMLNGKSNELENLSSELKSTILLLNTEKDATLLKNQESSMRVSDLESELSQLQAELQTSLDGETKKHIECEAALLLVTDLHSKSQDEVNKLAMDIEELTGKLSEVENIKMDLENIVNKHTKDIHILR